jgi:formylglycine-generating enzyme required for sulfatase activity
LNAREGGQQVRATTPVGIYPNGASPCGAYDCAGNVWEWCATQWGKRYPYDVKEDEWTEIYLQGDAARVLRGGSWNDDQDFARCAFRYRYYPHDRYSFFGLRVVSPI